MSAVICGSLAFDTIMTFEGRFSEQILPDQLHILNVSFLVPALRREFGGCAGNIAYSLRQLGGAPLPMATVGSDGVDYVARMNALGISTEFVRQVGDTLHNTIDKVAEPARSAVNRASSSAHEGVDRMASTVQAAADKVDQRARHVREMPHQAADHARDYVRNRPLQALGAAFAIGWLLGRLGAYR